MAVVGRFTMMSIHILIDLDEFYNIHPKIFVNRMTENDRGAER